MSAIVSNFAACVQRPQMPQDLLLAIDTVHDCTAVLQTEARNALASLYAPGLHLTQAGSWGARDANASCPRNGNVPCYALTRMCSVGLQACPSSVRLRQLSGANAGSSLWICVILSHVRCTDQPIGHPPSLQLLDSLQTTDGRAYVRDRKLKSTQCPCGIFCK